MKRQQEELTINNLQFHSVEYLQNMGKLYAFVTCIDIQENGLGKEKKKYWGEVSETDNKNDILNIMMHGGKWKNLP